MPVTYKKIASTTLTSSQASISFTSLPTTYDDLVLKVSARNDVTTSSGYMRVAFNSSTSNLSSRVLYGVGNGQGSFTAPSWSFFYVTSSLYGANSFSNSEIYIPNYRSSANKSFAGESVVEDNTTSVQMCLTAALWGNTAAITSIQLTTHNNSTDAAANFVSGTTATLYGISKS